MKRILVLLLAVVLFLTGCVEKPDPAWQEEFDKGQYWAEEGYFSESVQAYVRALEIDPQSKETYLAMVDVHTAFENTIGARYWIKKAIETIGEEKDLLEKQEWLLTQPLTRHRDTSTADGYGSKHESWGSWAVDQLDEQERVVLTTQYKADGTVEYYRKHRYDEAGHEVYWGDHYPDGTTGHQTIREYDESGRQTKEAWLDDNGETYKGGWDRTYYPNDSGGEWRETIYREYDESLRVKKLEESAIKTDAEGKQYSLKLMTYYDYNIRDDQVEKSGEIVGYALTIYCDSTMIAFAQYAADGTLLSAHPDGTLPQEECVGLLERCRSVFPSLQSQ